MSLRSLTTGLTLYRNGTFTLEQAARQSGVSPAKLTTELRARGISIRTEDRDVGA